MMNIKILFVLLTVLIAVNVCAFGDFTMGMALGAALSSDSGENASANRTIIIKEEKLKTPRYTRNLIQPAKKERRKWIMMKIVPINGNWLVADLDEEFIYMCVIPAGTASPKKITLLKRRFYSESIIISFSRNTDPYVAMHSGVMSTGQLGRVVAVNLPELKLRDKQP